MKLQFLVTLAILMITSGLLSSCSPHPDARLIQFQQMQLAQLEQANKELADFQTKIQETKTELELVDNLMGAATALPLLNGELVTLAKRDELYMKFSQLYEQRQLLLATTHYLEQDIEEIKLYTKLVKYHEFKLSQLNGISARLIELRIDIDQKTLLGGELASAQQEYNLLLVQRQFIQQNLEQLKQLQGKD